MVKLKSNLPKIPAAFCTLLLIVFLLVSFVRPVTAFNQDLGRHILLGNIIIDTLSVPKINLLTYTNYNFPFVNSHWGSEVVFASLNYLGGVRLLSVFALAIILLALLPQLAYLCKKNNSLTLLVSAFLYLVLISVRSDIRPELFSALFTSWFVLILYSKDIKLLFLLPLLEIFWVNLHIYFFVGPVLIFLFLLANLWETKRLEKSLIYSLVLTVLAVVINPSGLSGVIFPLTVFGNYAFPVAENQNVSTLIKLFNGDRLVFPLVLISVLLLLEIVNFKKIKKSDLLLSIAFSVATLVVFRNILLFVFATFIPFTTVLDLTVVSVKKRFKNFNFSLIAPFLWLVFVAIILATIAEQISLRSVGFGTQESTRGAVDYIQKEEISGPIFNNFDAGGYLSYRLYPQLIYIDNRPEAHSVAFMKNYLAMDVDYSRFKNEDKKYNFNSVLITFEEEPYGENTLMANLVKDENYVPVYFNSYSIVLVKNKPQNQRLINGSKINLNDLNIKPQSRAEALRYLTFFKKIYWHERVKELGSSWGLH